MHLMIIFIAIVISIIRNAEAGQHCFQCHEVPTPQTCLRVVECGEHEQCFVESIVTTSGSLLYNVGCISKEKCSARKRRSDFNKRDDLVTCLECCSEGDFCNVAGCGHSYVPQVNRGLYCFHCDVQENQHSCLDVVVCGQDEECLLEPNLDFLPKVFYRSKCGGKDTCLSAQKIHNNGNPALDPGGLFVGRRNTDYGDCPACCNTSFCNNICTINNSVAIHGTQAPITTPLVTHVHQKHTSAHIPKTTHAQTTAKPPATTNHFVLTKATPVITHLHQEISSTHTPSITHVVHGTPHSQPCQSYPGFQLLEHNLGCVEYVRIPTDKFTAHNYCRMFDSHVVNIESEDKQHAIFRFMQAHNASASSWIGLVSTITGTHNRNDWRWEGGLPYSYKHWGLGEPDADGDCVIIYTNGHWRDMACTEHHSFICEKNHS